MNTISAVVRTDFVAWHNWEAASEDREYLRSMHRHKFMVEVAVDQRMTPGESLDDRQIEYHALLDIVRLWVGTLPSLGDKIFMNSWSCEHLALNLANYIQQFWATSVAVDVFEDGECGARVRVYYG